MSSKEDLSVAMSAGIPVKKRDNCMLNAKAARHHITAFKLNLLLVGMLSKFEFYKVVP